MKKLLLLMMIVVMAVGMCACGGDHAEDVQSENTEQLMVEESEESTTELSYTDSMVIGGLDIKYDSVAGNLSRASGGEKFFYKDNSVYFGICDDYADAAESWDEVIENSKENIFYHLSDSAEFGYETEQIIDFKEEVEINGINWLKVTGVFKNVEEGADYEQIYVAYYANRETTDPDGASVRIPLYIIGMPQTLEPTEDLEVFVDEFVSQITEADSWS